MVEGSWWRDGSDPVCSNFASCVHTHSHCQVVKRKLESPLQLPVYGSKRDAITGTSPLTAEMMIRQDKGGKGNEEGISPQHVMGVVG